LNGGEVAVKRIEEVLPLVTLSNLAPNSEVDRRDAELGQKAADLELRDRLSMLVVRPWTVLHLAQRCHELI